MKKLFLFTFMVLFSCANTWAQDKIGSITGKVLDENAESVVSANILLLKVKDSSLVRGAVSNLEGIFEINGIDNGNYLLSVRMVGYDNYFVALTVSSEKSKIELGEIKINPSSMMLKEVGVTAARPMMEIKNNAIVLNVATSPILSSGNTLDVLSKAPGVTIDQDGKISFKGKPNVVIMIDGKLTYLSADDVSRFLQNTPAENIESVEMIENPSAKYDAAGNTGIINIKFKKDKNLGLNGSTNLALGYGRYGKLSGGFSLNYRQKKFNLFGNYNANYNKRYNNINLFRTMPNENTTEKSVFDQANEITAETMSHNAKAGLDFFINDKTTIGVLFTGNIGNMNGNNIGGTQISGLNTNPYNQLNSTNAMKDNWNNGTANINFKKVFKAGELTIDGDYSYWERFGKQNNINRFDKGSEIAVSPSFDARTNTDAKIQIRAFKADYTLPLKNGLNIETGVKSSWVTTNNEILFQVNKDNVLVKDNNLSNTFEYDEKINAAYLNANKQFGKKFSVQAGLRMEHTASDGYSETLNQRNKRDYLNFFPSLSLSYSMNEKHKIGLSYSRRIDRPNYQDLNPFVFFLDKYTYQRGNPFLNPQLSHSAGVNYSFGSSFFATLNYTQTNSFIGQIIQQDLETQANYIMNSNLDKINSVNLNLTAPLTLAKWWSLNASVTGLYNQVGTLFQGENIKREKFSFMTNLNNTISLPKGIKLEIMFRYQSPQIYALFESANQYQTDLGVSKSFMDDRLKFRASLSDVFKTLFWQGNTQAGTVSNLARGTWESRVFRINLTYNFGRNEIKGARRRSTASDDIQQRTGGGNN
ncbi:MAG: hypothetical protein EAZ97_07795 [Bacteroidetes bacterium]|nr:MAG: hypothetical protein EAZ97_07795 [Bacteroidota bacterium]